MSKWQLPTQKGTELWPSSTRSPVKVLFEGTPPGSPLARELFNELGGEIGQFYAKSAQNYALGVVSQQGNSKRLGDTTMSYKNNQGNETVRVKPAKQIVQRARRVVDESFWDSAIIELEYAPGDSVPFLAAFLTIPNLEPLATVTGQDVMRYPGVAQDGIAWNAGGAFGTTPIISYPDEIPSGLTRALSATYRSSLRVDLQQLRGVPQVVVELWGYREPFLQLTDEVMFSLMWALEGRRGDTGFVEPAPLRFERGPTYPKILETFPELAGYANYWYFNGTYFGQAEAPEPLPEYSGAGDFIQSSTFTVSGGLWPSGRDPSVLLGSYPAENVVTYWDDAQLHKKTDRVQGVRFIHDNTTIYDNVRPPDPPASGMWAQHGFDSKIYYKPVYREELVYPPLPATVKGVMFKYGIADTWSDVYDGAQTVYSQWEQSATFPERFPLGVVGEASIPAIDLPADVSLANHLGHRYLGRVIMDTRTGSISFKPA